MDHVEECPSYYVDCWGTVCYCDYSHICICRELLACEERMINAAREAVKGVNWFNDEGKMLSAIVATAESLSAIDALRKKP